MAKFTVNGAHRFEGSRIEYRRGELYVDGDKKMDLNDDRLDIESDGGSINVTSSDRPVNIRSSSPGGQVHVTSMSSSTSVGSGSGGGEAGNAHADGEKIAREVQEKVQAKMDKAFPPGFPFHDKK